MINSIIFYNGILLFSTIFLFLSEHAKTKLSKNILISISFLIVFLPSSLRYELGIDYYSYNDIFNDIVSGNSRLNIEYGFYLLNYAIIYVGNRYEIFIAFMSFITLIFAYLSYPTKNKWLFHLLYILIFYFDSYGFLRTSLVISMGAYALSGYIFKAWKIKHFIIIITAFFIHKSAFLFLFPYAGIKSRIINNKITLKFILLLTIILIITHKEILYLIYQILHFFSSKYASYFNNLYFSSSFEINTGIGIIIKYTIITYLFITINRLSKFNKRYYAIIIFIILFVFSYSISILSMRIFSRATDIFSLGIVFGIYIVSYHRMNITSYCFIILTTLYLIAAFNMNIMQGSTDHMLTCDGSKISPYVSILNKEDSKRDPYYTRTNQDCKAKLNLM